MVDVSAEDVSIALAFAWKFRCAVIKPTNSVVKSTFDRSRAPALIVPKPAVRLQDPRVGRNSKDEFLLFGLSKTSFQTPTGVTSLRHGAGGLHPGGAAAQSHDSPTRLECGDGGAEDPRMPREIRRALRSACDS